MSVLIRTVLPVMLLGSLLTGCATHSDGTAPSTNALGRSVASSAGWWVAAWAPLKVVGGRPVVRRSAS